MESTNNTPFKLPLWSDWTVKIKEKHKLCLNCNSTVASLKVLAIESLFGYLKEANKLHDLAKILQSNLIPPILFVDIACQLFAQKQWSVLRSLISHWPFEVFQLSNIISSTYCSPCWLAYLESDDVDDPEKEGGNTERQLLRKVFKHVLDGYFFVVKGTLDNESTKSPLRTLDLTLDSSHNIRGFLWEDEFRRLGRRVTKTLDVCVLAGLHKKVRAKQHRQQQCTTTTTYCEVPNYEAIGYWSPEQVQHPAVTAEMKEVEPTFEISTWEGEELMKLKPQAPNYSAEELSKSPEIGVWNGNAMDLSHLTEMPIFTIIIDTCISEKSTDILTWIQQRYDDFAPLPSPVSVSIRFLEVALHEERKFDALFSRLPEYIQGLQLSEICERRSVLQLASNLCRFSNIRFLDLGSCAFDLADQPQAVECMSFAMSQLPRLERLSLAHNCLSGCLSQLLSPLQQGLKLLDLSSCSLSDDDLDYLAESTHRNTLRSLSLASNELAVHWDGLLTLTEQLGGLRILDLSSNDFVESQLITLARCTLGPLSSLFLLDLSWHQLPLSQLVYIIELLAEKTLLRTFCLSTPVDMAECGYDQPDSWQIFVDFTTLLTIKHRRGRSPLTLHWCLM